MWAIGELGVDYVRDDVAGSFGFPDDYPNPNRVVPTVLDGDVVVYESNACVRYVCRSYGAGSLWPQEPALLARADQWMDWQRGEIHTFFNLFMLLIRTPEAERKPSAVDGLTSRTGAAYEALDAHLANSRFIAGDELTMADMPYGPMTYRYLKLDVPRPNLPNVERWFAEVSSRPAFQHHVAIDFGRNLTEWQAAEAANAGIQ